MRITGTGRAEAQVALTWVLANTDRFAGFHARFNDATDLRVHLPDAG